MSKDICIFVAFKRGDIAIGRHTKDSLSNKDKVHTKRQSLLGLRSCEADKASPPKRAIAALTKASRSTVCCLQHIIDS